ncbi:hypothetical protein DYU05_18910 [Mucilaginibacter terrenus]|uniref:DUF4350 domain-containing protein n=1 Tax=Mucilaginibacter terrenus TaxID=2482727 RepID=A0A3E2NK49_9SPHI|nr:hypothetical protein [Mucilaginibacter terrenus]RFZ81355.1 hypothetical protein DYU05_18910 [Mucilaginibacter terrenus]
MIKKLLLSIVISLGLACNIRAQTVALDYYFNREVKKTANGAMQRFHYTWEDQSNSGFSLWGKEFDKLGAKLDSIPVAPTAENLKNVSVYIIVDPDTRKESASPNYITPTDADVIAAWVKKGGVLLLMANDSANTELQHFNILAAKFGMHFNNDMQNHVIDDAHFNDGAISIKNNKVFKTATKVFLKDVCSIGLSGNAKPLLTAKTGAAIAAISKHGKGCVIAVGDPWLYNEYVNGRLPAGYENDKAMADLARYVISLKK